MDNKLPLAPYVLLALAMVGLGDTLFLSYYAYLHIIPSCAIGGCEIVLASPYSHPLGVPFGYIGLLYYLHVFAVALLTIIFPKSRGVAFAALAYTGIGLLCSIGFELFQFFVIGALCLYCGISAATTLGLFAASVWHRRRISVVDKIQTQG